MGFDESKDRETIATLIERYIDDEEIRPEKAILHNEEGVDLIPSNLSLSATAENLTNAMMNREYALKSCLSELKSIYDYIIIDCMPSLNMVTINALASADEVIIPVQSQYLSARGMGNLINIVSKVKRQINPTLEVGGILLTLVDNRTKLPSRVREDIEYQYGDTVSLYKTQIPCAVKTAESTEKGTSIFKYDKNSKVAQAYSDFAKEVLSDGKQRENEIAKTRVR